MVSGRERRRATRRQPNPSEPVSRARVRAGRELAVIDISSCGVLVEGEARLLPGTHLEVHVVARAGRTLVRSCVMRASVADLRSDRVLYRAALAFEHMVDLGSAPAENEGLAGGNSIPSGAIAHQHDPGTAYPAHAS
jgi:hypothetical protein